MKKLLLAGLLSLLAFPSLMSAQDTPTADVDTVEQSSCITITNNLRYRTRDASVNNEVSDLQDFLNMKGYLKSGPTGYFGLATFNAVKKFQSASGFAPTGYVGPLTRGKISALTCGGSTEIPIATQTSTPVSVYSQTQTTTTSTTSLPAGCTSAVGYSPLTGKRCLVPATPAQTPTNLPAGCTSAVGYSPLTGKRCLVPATPAPTPTSVPAGCTSTVGYSSVTGNACNGTQVLKPIYPSGCTSNSGWSSTTGQSCGATTIAPTVSLTAYPTTIALGQSSTLTLSSANAGGGCSGVLVTDGKTFGTTTVSPTQTTSYGVTCYEFPYNGGRSASTKVTVSVVSATTTASTTPMITSLSTYGGKGGDRVIINGSGFNSSSNVVYYQNGVSFGGTGVGTNLSVSSDGKQISFLVLSLTGGVYQLQVQNSSPNIPAVNSNAVNFTISPTFTTSPIISYLKINGYDYNNLGVAKGSDVVLTWRTSGATRCFSPATPTSLLDTANGTTDSVFKISSIQKSAYFDLYCDSYNSANNILKSDIKSVVISVDAQPILLTVISPAGGRYSGDKSVTLREGDTQTISWLNPGNIGTVKVQLLASSANNEIGSVVDEITLSGADYFAWNINLAKKFSGEMHTQPLTPGFYWIKVSTQKGDIYGLSNTTGFAFYLDKANTQQLVPIVEVVGTPTLSLQYDLVGKESMLVANYRVKITAGSQVLSFPTSSGTSWTPLGFSFRTTEGNGGSGVMVTTSGPTSISAGSSANYDIRLEANPNQILAGNYYAFVDSYVYGLDPVSGYQNGIAATLIGNTKTNAVIVVGERAPYITGVVSDASSPNNGYIVNGVRFQTSNQVTINGVTKTLSYQSWNAGIAFSPSDFGITAPGAYSLQVSTNEGASNIVSVNVTASTANIDLELRNVTKETFHPYGFNATVCNNGTQSVSELRAINPQLPQNLPLIYIIYDSLGRKFQGDASVSGTPEIVKNGQCSTYGWTIQPTEQVAYDQTKKVTLILDQNNIIAETNENNNSFNLEEAIIQPTLAVAQSANSPSGPLIVGAQKLAEFTLMAPTSEDINVTSITIGNQAIDYDLGNIKLFDTSNDILTPVQIGQTALSLIGGKAQFYVTTWVIPRGSSKTLSIYADIPSGAKGVNMGITAISAVGKYSGQTATIPGLPVYGNVLLATSIQSPTQLAGLIGAFMKSSLPTPLPTPTPTPTSKLEYEWTRNLEVNSPYTDDVSALQMALTEEGVFSGEVSGGFYTQTYLAVKAFQAKYGIESTGFVGPQTRMKLNELY